MNYIIVDLEATCWERSAILPQLKREQSPNEIIEIGAVCIDQNKNLLGEIDLFVQPKVHPKLSAFCIDLTSITQELVDFAPMFPDALQQFQNWIKNFGEEFILCSWGFYDRVQFENDCKLHKLNTDWLHHHISLKHQYGKIKNIKPIGMKSALQKEKFSLDGTHHRGLDDAKNISKIFVKYFDEWDKGTRGA
ncbi:MAG: exonuclease domain-containing protein [Bacteroidia bacterium]|nr:exonuclease domain-containing protein [Bacteroidia bacterium]